MKLSPELVVAGHEVDVRVESKDAQSPEVGPKGDGGVTLLEPIEGVPRRPHSLSKVPARDTPAQPGSLEALAQCANLPLDRREWSTKAATHDRYYGRYID